MIYCETFDNGDIQYTNEDGELHREDGPAIIESDGNEFWYLNGSLHRDNGPAICLTDGTFEWYKNGIKHRDDGPAVIRFQDITSTSAFEALLFLEEEYIPISSLAEAYDERKITYKFYLNDQEFSPEDFEKIQILINNLKQPTKKNTLKI